MKEKMCSGEFGQAENEPGPGFEFKNFFES